MREAVQEYLSALEKGDITKVVSLFEPDGWVSSPFLGRMTAREFFPKVAETSSGSEQVRFNPLFWNPDCYHYQRIKTPGF